MQNRYYKNRRLAIGLCMLFITGVYPVRAQTEQAKYLAYLQVFKKKISDADISYKYTFSLFSKSSRNDMLEVKGKFCKVGRSYLDSSSTGISLMSDKYFFRARYQEKDVYIYDLRSLEKNMGIKKMSNMNVVANIPDSLILKNGSFTTEETSKDIMNLRYVYAGKDSPLQEVSMKIRKADTGLLELKIVLSDDGYKKRMTLYDFKGDFDKRVLNTSGYFTVSGKKVNLSDRLRAFKVNALL